MFAPRRAAGLAVLVPLLWAACLGPWVGWRAPSRATVTVPPTAVPPTGPPPTARASPTPPPTPTPPPSATPRAWPATWSEVAPLPPGPIQLRTLHMVNAHQGWALSAEGRVLITDDGAHTWAEVSPPRWPRAPQTAVFVDVATAYLAVDDAVLVTHDRGDTWQWARIAWNDRTAVPNFTPDAMTAIDPQQAWLHIHLEGGMSHDYALLAHTADGGASWQVLADPWDDAAGDLMLAFTTGLAFAPQGRFGWATKDMGPIAGISWVRTQDGGDSWTWHNEPAPDYLGETFCATRDPYLWGPGQGALLALCMEPEAGLVVPIVVRVTSSEGVHMVAVGTALVDEARLTFVRPEEAYLVVTLPDEDVTAVYVSTDGGRTWAPQGRLSGRAVDATWLPGGQGWLLLSTDDGAATVVQHTADRGTTWTPVPAAVVVP